ncbi:uncharacterized protein LOC103511797 [Gryllus bimaculatus]|nr:uncharacterized protein LOC103511797 [Gryllus bimaculatus]
MASGDGPEPDDAVGNSGRQMGLSRECNDRVIMPCDSEEFIMSRQGAPMMCDLLHCGTSFCQAGDSSCRIESSTTPFNIQVQFGRALREESPEDNLGMCLRYEQLPCTA